MPEGELYLMKKFIIAVAGLLLLLTGCKRSGDVLATYEGGQITRVDFYEWMEFRNMTKEAILKNKSQQKSQLEQVASERLAIREAKKAGFEKNEDYQYLIDFFRQNYYAQYLPKVINTKGEFKEKAAKVKIIKFLVKNYKIDNNRRREITGKELESAFDEQIEKAKAVISELIKGASFEDLAKKYSEDPSKTKGGDIGFIIEGLRSEFFTKAVFALKQGEFTKTPFRDGSAVYIAKVDKFETVTGDNIDKIAQDKGQQMSLRRYLMHNSVVKLQEKLMKAKNIENNVEKANLSNPAAVVYKIGDKEFRAGDLNKIVAFINTRKKKMGFPDKEMSDPDKRKMAKDVFLRDVMRREVIRRGYDKEEKFKKELQFTLDYYLSGIYQSEVVMGDTRVTPREIRDYYVKNLEKMYSRNLKEGNKTINKPIPFESVKNSIEHRLINIKRSEKVKAWTNDLLSKNNFKINESELEGK
jgi:peptidyl-prolyl cis-trans isomerase C